MPFVIKKILSAEQTRKVDEFTMENEPITSIDLMERASLGFVNEIIERLDKKTKILVVCGVGNNGGDGFAIARILQVQGFQVDTILIKFSDLSPDCQINFDKIEDCNVINEENNFPNFEKYDFIIDAILGSGISRAADGLIAKVIQRMNNADAQIFSVDVPSGLFCDNSTPTDNIVQSNLTISFQRPKLSFFFPENEKYVGEVIVIDIGLKEEFIQNQVTHDFILDEGISDELKIRTKYSHKGNYGHALLIAGSYGKMGAAVLASKACLRSGAGLVTAMVPKCGYEIIQNSVPEAMCLVDENEYQLTNIPISDSFNAIGIGPGIGSEKLTSLALEKWLKEIKTPLVIDADAINILSQNPELLKHLPPHSILTPHLKEFERLVGTWDDSDQRNQLAISFCKKYNCILILKGAHTAICNSLGQIFYNSSGNPGMATGGSGDVLTGIITGLLAQNYISLQAALIGVYYHGLAGDHAAKVKGMNALIASDIIEKLRIEKD